MIIALGLGLPISGVLITPTPPPASQGQEWDMETNSGVVDVESGGPVQSQG